MRLPKLLFQKEWRELTASRAYWLLLLAIGPLVGNGFINAVNLYAEASGIHGGAAALPQGLTPLDGMLVPTFGAYDLAVTLLFPFVAIRMLSAEKENGALKLALQFPAGLGATIAAKAAALTAGWLAAWAPGLAAVALWKFYGGHLHLPETANLIAGHGLRMLLSAGVAMAAAALAESAASAAIATLGFTLGTWVLDFIANGRGGWLQQVAAYTPTAALRFFEQGTLRLSTCLMLATLALAGFAIAALWLHPGRDRWTRARGLLAILLLVGLAALLARVAHASWDLSENRRNSFSRADEAALRGIASPLRITMLLAAEDPRLADYERGILNKLRRLMPRLEVVYGAQSRTGLFEGAEEHYGEIWYELEGRKAMNRSTTEPIVLEHLYQLAGMAPPQGAEEAPYPGYPLAAHPRFASALFYVLWPLAVALLWWRTRRSQR